MSWQSLLARPCLCTSDYCIVISHSLVFWGLESGPTWGRTAQGSGTTLGSATSGRGITFEMVTLDSVGSVKPVASVSLEDPLWF